jgi:hypothetical protein
LALGLAPLGAVRAKQSENRGGNPFRVLLTLFGGHLVKPL